MKYFPLVWAALWRKPVRLILTLLSVVVAFALFGMMTGFKASFDHFADTARADRIYVNSRFAGGLTESMGVRIAHMPGVKYVAMGGGVGGYYQNQRNNVGVQMVGSQAQYVFPELNLTPQQYSALAANPAGAIFSRTLANRLKIKKGDVLPITAPGIQRADGTKTWAFHILDIVNDISTRPQGFAIGNFKYFNEARARAIVGTGLSYTIIVTDPARGDAIAKQIDLAFANSSTSTRSISEKTAAENATSGGGGIDYPFVMESIAGAGLFMILFLTGNAIAQSVRERIPEFAVLKTIGYSDAGVMALVFAEAMIPCLIGAGLGMALASEVAANFTKLLPPNVGFPPPYMSPKVYGVALLFAVLVALISAVIPATRISRLDVATALSGR